MSLWSKASKSSNTTASSKQRLCCLLLFFVCPSLCSISTYTLIEAEVSSGPLLTKGEVPHFLGVFPRFPRVEKAGECLFRSEASKEKNELEKDNNNKRNLQQAIVFFFQETNFGFLALHL